MKKEQPKVTRGSGNVFADLGLPHPEVELARVELALAIKDTIVARGLTQEQVATLAGESQPNISNIVGGRLHRFSCERLLRVLVALGKDVMVSLQDAPPDRARGTVSVMATPAPGKTYAWREVKRRKQV